MERRTAVSGERNVGWVRRPLCSYGSLCDLTGRNSPHEIRTHTGETHVRWGRGPLSLYRSHCDLTGRNSLHEIKTPPRHTLRSSDGQQQYLFRTPTQETRTRLYTAKSLGGKTPYEALRSETSDTSPKPQRFSSSMLLPHRTESSQRSGPAPSYVSLKSDRSIGARIDFVGEVEAPALRNLNHHISDYSDGRPHSHLNSKQKLLKEEFFNYIETELNRVWSVLSPVHPEPPDSKDDKQWGSIREEFLKITVHHLRNIKEQYLAEQLWSRSRAAESGRRLKRRLQKKFHRVTEGVAKVGHSVPLNQIYTELYITEGGTQQVNQEHEVRQIETVARKENRPETTIRQEDLFKPSPDRGQPIRSLLTRGVAGIGKTILTQKLTLDWAEEKTHQNFHLVFPFTFRELSVLKEKKLSLMELVHLFFPETRESGLSSFEDVQVLFIFDGLDECRLPLDFNNPVLTETTESTSVDVLLTNLIKGNLLPSAHLWITTRPAAANQIPPECVDMVTEVRGFNDLQKEEYFRRRFRDEEQTTIIISHIRSSRSLHIMCHIPIFCWITATVLEDMLKSRETRELPKTLTEMYIYFLVIQTKVQNLKYGGGYGTDTVWDPESRNIIESLGKLAFEQLQKGNLIFYESDLTECGINITAASVYSGLFTQIFKEETRIYQDKVFCFIHLTIQEFLAALHVHLTFTNIGVNLLDSKELPLSGQKSGQEKFYQSAVVQTLSSPNGHLDLFLRFLLGLSLKPDQITIRRLLIHTGSDMQTNNKTAEFIRKKINEEVSPEKTINLFHCLNELKDSSLVKEVQWILKSGGLSRCSMSPAQWSALAFILLSSEEDLDVFDLNKYSASEEAFLRLLPVVEASTRVLLIRCGLSERSCPPLSSVLSSPSSSLTHLDLSDNDLKDSGVKLLCVGLGSPHCYLESLRLTRCGLTEGSCPHLASVLSSPPPSLTQLDLSDNDLQDSGVMFLCVGLKRPCCHLETLSLSGCMISEEGCVFLASALSSNPYHLRELDLSYNHPEGLRLGHLSAGLERPDWRLETLRVDHGGEQRLRSGLLKYFCFFTLDPNTAHQRLLLSNNCRTVHFVTEDQNYPEHPDRFNHSEQLMCKDFLTGRCYWEVEWRGRVNISVTYKTDSKGVFGHNDQSWSLTCSDEGYHVCHNKTENKIQSSCISERVAVFVDCPAGTVSFYTVSSDAPIHLHTFFTSFTQPLYPGFTVSWPGSSVTIYEPTFNGSYPKQTATSYFVTRSTVHERCSSERISFKMPSAKISGKTASLYK